MNSPLTAVIGQSLTWEQALPLVRALRDIAQCTPDIEAECVATNALEQTFKMDALNILFGTGKL